MKEETDKIILMVKKLVEKYPKEEWIISRAGLTGINLSSGNWYSIYHPKVDMVFEVLVNDDQHDNSIYYSGYIKSPYNLPSTQIGWLFSAMLRDYIAEEKEINRLAYVESREKIIQTLEKALDD